MSDLMAQAMSQGVIGEVITAHDADVFASFGDQAQLLPNVVVGRDGSEVEVDLLGFVSGKWLVVECKGLLHDESSVVRQLVKIRKVCEELGPHELWLAAESDISNSVQELVDRFHRWDQDPIGRVTGVDGIVDMLASTSLN